MKDRYPKLTLAALWLVPALTVLIIAGCMRQAPVMEQMEARLKAMPAPKAPYVEGIPYKETWFGDVKLDLYLPYSYSEDQRAEIGKHPVYVHVHGGSWLFGNRKFVRFADPLVEALRKNGIAVISIDYRKVNKVGFQTMVDDAVDSLSWLRDNAEKYHLDLQQVVLHGPSAGGHLVLMMGFTHEIDELNIRLIIDEYGPADLIALKEYGNTERRNFLSFLPDFMLTNTSPIRHVRKDLPPIYMVHGELDEMVPLAQSTELKAELEKLGVAVELDIIPQANHGLLNQPAEEREKLSEKRLGKILAALPSASNTASEPPTPPAG